MPNDADEKPIVAKVRILTKKEKTSHFEYEAEVITGLRNVKKGQKLDVAVINHTCQHAGSANIGDIYFIAGEMQEINHLKGQSKLFFKGEWKIQNLMMEKPITGTHKPGFSNEQ